jgi:hypothetical protein
LSLVVQAFPSLHVLASLFACTHTPDELHESSVHGLLSSQLAAEQQMPALPLAPDTQFPLWQSVPALQVAPSPFRLPQVVTDPQTVLFGQAAGAGHLPVLSHPLTYWLPPVQLAGHVSLSGALFTEVQAPKCPLKLHAMQLPVQVVLQQTPSTQDRLPEHFLLELQASPAFSVRHVVPMQ